jgi:hypothetical protein
VSLGSVPQECIGNRVSEHVDYGEWIRGSAATAVRTHPCEQGSREAEKQRSEAGKQGAGRRQQDGGRYLQKASLSWFSSECKYTMTILCSAAASSRASISGVSMNSGPLAPYALVYICRNRRAAACFPIQNGAQQRPTETQQGQPLTMRAPPAPSTRRVLNKLHCTCGHGHRMKPTTNTHRAVGRRKTARADQPFQRRHDDRKHGVHQADATKQQPDSGNALKDRGHDNSAADGARAGHWRR